MTVRTTITAIGDKNETISKRLVFNKRQVLVFEMKLVVNKQHYEVNYSDTSITQNTRGAYPTKFI